MSDAKEKLKALKELTAQGNDSLYERIGLAGELLEDAEWIAEIHGGDWWKAHDALEHEFFAVLGQHVRLAKLIKMHASVPHTRWHELRFNLVAIASEYDAAQSKKPKQRKSRKAVAWKAEAEKRQEQLEEVAFRERRAQQDVERLQAQAIDKDDIIAGLRNKVARLEARVEQLEAELAESREAVAA